MSCDETRCRKIKRERDQFKSERDAAWDHVKKLSLELRTTRSVTPTATLNRVDLLLHAEAMRGAK